MHTSCIAAEFVHSDVLYTIYIVSEFIFSTTFFKNMLNSIYDFCFHQLIGNYLIYFKQLQDMSRSDQYFSQYSIAFRCTVQYSIYLPTQYITSTPWSVLHPCLFTIHTTLSRNV